MLQRRCGRRGPQVNRRQVCGKFRLPCFPEQFFAGDSRCPHRETVRGERVNRGNGRRPRRDAWNRSAFACRLAAHSRGGCRCQIGLGKPTCKLAATGCPRERCSAISASLSHSSEKRIHSFGLIDKLARARQRSAVWRHVSGSMFGMGALRFEECSAERLTVKLSEPSSGRDARRPQ